MKAIIISFICLFAVLLVNSCKNDDPTPDPCKNITCLNGGNCVNGLCACPQGYSGPDCGTQVAPTKMKILKIEVTRFPATDGGAGWDLTSGPDIYPKISKGTTVIWEASTYFQNANLSSYEFTPSPSIDLTSPSDQYTISLYDYDDVDSDDFMGGIYFTPYLSTAKFPSVLTIDASGSVAFKIHVAYVW